MSLSDHKKFVKETIARAKAALQRSEKKKKDSVSEIIKEEAEALEAKERRDRKGKQKAEDPISFDDALDTFLATWTPGVPPEPAHMDDLRRDPFNPVSISHL
ncbi:hypothetical protein G6F56_003888 [Rhizopus delemar]|nr:hypothetical protein G6F56_003888 [Rhizopus delemar]